MSSDSYTKHYERTFNHKVKKFNNKAGLLPYFAEMIGNKKSVRIAEVGCALVNTIGDMWPSAEVEVVCSDKYGSEFMELWEKNGVEPLHTIHTEDVENLSYADNSFDIVHCRNTLDHTKNPLKAIEEMKRVSKEWVYLAHALNQMDTYGGHHLFNIFMEGDDVIFQGKEDSFCLDRKFENYFDGELIHSKLRL